MVKTQVFKKITALTAALAMTGAFAVSASAATVTTTTAYKADTNNTKVTVTANVSGITGAQVTYYATNGNTPVYVDQKAASNGSATFDYVTDATNLKSTVKVGETGATSATDATVTGYKIYIDGNENSGKVVPTAFTGSVVLAYTLETGKTIKSVKLGETEVSEYSYENNNLTISVASISTDTKVTVTTETAQTTPEITGSFTNAAGVVSNGNNDSFTSNEESDVDVNTTNGDRRLSVLGCVIGESEEYGVIVSTSDITAGTFDSKPTDTYVAKGKNTNGYFAVQLIDTATENADFVKKGTKYYTAIYFKTTDGKYTVVKGNEVTINSNN